METQNSSLEIVGTVAHSMRNTGELKWGKWSQQGPDPKVPENKGYIQHPAKDGRVLKQGMKCQLGGMYWFDVQIPD